MRKNKILWPLAAMMCVLVCVFALAGCEQPNKVPKLAVPTSNIKTDAQVTNGFVLKLTGEVGSTVRYELGTDLVTSVSKVYPSEGVSISSETTIRAKAFKEGFESSDELVIHLYVMGAPVLKVYGTDVMADYDHGIPHITITSPEGVTYPQDVSFTLELTSENEEPIISVASLGTVVDYVKTQKVSIKAIASSSTFHAETATTTITPNYQNLDATKNGAYVYQFYDGNVLETKLIQYQGNESVWAQGHTDDWIVMTDNSYLIDDTDFMKGLIEKYTDKIMVCVITDRIEDNPSTYNGFYYETPYIEYVTDKQYFPMDVSNQYFVLVRVFIPYSEEAEV